MKIKFLHISIENFLSLGKVDLDLDGLGFTLINGINTNPIDNAASNGVGKSAIFDALVWCLTGETIRGATKNITNIHTEGGAKVELNFILDKNEYKICRYKDHKEYGSNLQIFVNGEDKSGKGIRDSEKILETYLAGLDLQFIGSVIIFGQGLPQRFTNNTPSGRKEVLEKLSKSDFMIEDIKKRLSDRKLKLNQDLRIAEDNILKLNTEQSMIKTRLQESENELNNMQDTSSLIKAMQDSEAIYSKLEPVIAENINKYNELDSQIVNLMTDRDNIRNESVAIDRSIEDKYQQEIKDKANKFYQLNADCSNLQREITKAENVMDVCPTCHQKLPDVHKIDTSAQKKELEELKATLEFTKQDWQKSEDNKTKEKQEIKQSYDSKLLQIGGLIRNLSEQANNIKTCNKQLETEYNHQKTVYMNNKVQYDSYEQQKNRLIDTIKTQKQNLQDLDEKLVYDNKEREDLKNRLDVVNKMINIATRDFRGFLLTNVIDYIEKKAKSYSEDIFGTDRIKFELNGNNIDISYDDKMYENLSGGEMQKINIIVNLALRDMLCQFSNFSSNILVLDEITDALDKIGCNKVIETITKRLTDIESVFIITHRAELMVPTDTIITVVKDSDGVSRVR